MGGSKKANKRQGLCGESGQLQKLLWDGCGLLETLEEALVDQG